MKKINIILDTDIGDDIDDAFALSALLNLQDRVNIVGITTVFVNTDYRARIAKKLIKLHGDENIPVFAGIRNGANNPNIDVSAKNCQFQDDLLDDKYNPDNNVYDDNGEAAINFLIEKAKELKEQLTIVCIGPFSNIGEAIRRDKEAFKDTTIVVMGGNFYSRAFNEWNVLCDPINAKELIESGLNVTCVGLDVTNKTKLTTKMYKDVLTYKPNCFYEYMTELIKLHRKSKHDVSFRPTLHDPLALFYSIFKDYIKVEKQLIKVETKGEYTTGETVNIDYLYDYEKEPKIGNRVYTAYKIDKKRFLNDFFKIYKND